MYKESYLKIWKDHKKERKENKNTIYSSNMQLMRLVSLNFPRISWAPPSMAGSGGYVSLFDLVKRETSAGLLTTTTLPEIRVSLDQAVRVAGWDWSNAYCQPTTNLSNQLLPTWQCYTLVFLGRVHVSCHPGLGFCGEIYPNAIQIVVSTIGGYLK